MSSRRSERILSWREADGHKDNGLKRYMASISVPLTLKVMRWSQIKKCDAMSLGRRVSGNCKRAKEQTTGFF